MAEASSRNAVVTGAAGGMGRAITQPGLTRTNIVLTCYRGDREKERTISTSSRWRSIRLILPARSSLRWTSRRMFRLRR